MYLKYREKDKMYCMEPYTNNMTRILPGKYDFYGQGTLNYILVYCILLNLEAIKFSIFKVLSIRH